MLKTDCDLHARRMFRSCTAVLTKKKVNTNHRDVNSLEISFRFGKFRKKNLKSHCPRLRTQFSCTILSITIILLAYFITRCIAYDLPAYRKLHFVNVNPSICRILNEKMNQLKI